MHINTHYISLTEDQKKIHTIIRVMLLVLCIFGFTLFVRELIFPTHIFNYDANIDSLANTVSRPYVTEHGTGFDIATYGDFTHATITITLPKEAQELPRNTSVTARKSYKAFLAPISTEKYAENIVDTFEVDGSYFIKDQDTLHSLKSENVFESYIFANNTNLTQKELSDLGYPRSSDVHGFASATLISSKEGIFVVDGKTKHPLQDELTFIALGYDFDNVRTSTSEERSLHKNARIFTIDSAHPFGTLFFTKDTDHIYIYDHDKLHKTTKTPLAKKHAISVDENSRTTFSSCSLEKSVFSKEKYTCTMLLNDIHRFSGNIFQFNITTPGVDIARSRISLSKAPTEQSLSLRIEELKKEISKYYIQQ